MYNHYGHERMGITKPSAFRFTDQDLAVLDAIQAHAGLRTRTETLRMVMQHFVRAERIRVVSAATRKRGSK